MDIIPKHFSDIKIQVGKKVYNLHKIILSRIPYFNKLFTSGLKESKQEIINLDIDKDSFEKILIETYSSALDSDYKYEDLDVKDYQTAIFLGLEKDVEYKKKKVTQMVTYATIIFPQTQDDLSPEILDFYIANESEIIHGITPEFIKAIVGKKNIENYPFLLYAYEALSKNYDTKYDLTEVYNIMFDENEKEVSNKKAIDRFLEEKYQHILSKDEVAKLRNLVSRLYYPANLKEWYRNDKKFSERTYTKRIKDFITTGDIDNLDFVGDYIIYLIQDKVDEKFIAAFKNSVKSF